MIFIIIFFTSILNKMVISTSIYKLIFSYYSTEEDTIGTYRTIDELYNTLDQFNYPINEWLDLDIDEILLVKDNIVIKKYSYKIFNGKVYFVEKDIIDKINEYMEQDIDIIDISSANNEDFIIKLSHERQPGVIIKQYILHRMPRYNNILV
jgi:hypothetical protein